VSVARLGQWKLTNVFLLGLFAGFTVVWLGSWFLG